MSVRMVGGRRSARDRRKRASTATFDGTRGGDSFWKEERERKNFGLYYMEKNGWSKGEGLGRQRQGHTTHLKAKVKNNNRGIGHGKKPVDNSMFQATMFMFNDILSGLNKKKKSDSKTSKSITASSQTASSLIKAYEVRHHLLSTVTVTLKGYGKFRAAKEIKNRSQEDKDAIFGGTNVNPHGFTENDQANYAMFLTDLAGMRSGRSGLGMGGGNKSGGGQTQKLTFGAFTKSGVITKDDILETKDDDHKEEEERPKEKTKKKKKKRKKEKTKEIEEEDEEREESPKLQKKQKKKKRKWKIAPFDCYSYPNEEIESLMKIKSKTKKKKKRKKEKSESVDIPTEDTINIKLSDSVTVNEGKTEKKKKKKNKKRKLESVEDADPEPTAKRRKKDKSEKKKKRKKSDSVSVSSSSDSILSAPITPVASDTEMEEESKTKRKSKKKEKKKSKKKSKKKKEKS